jgi:FlaA1/EpsC-like NDP-sugar epimerase
MNLFNKIIRTNQIERAFFALSAIQLYTGLRPGKKMFEETLTAEKGTHGNKT